jgi:hypothetical protein
MVMHDEVEGMRKEVGVAILRYIPTFVWRDSEKPRTPQRV